MNNLLKFVSHRIVFLLLVLTFPCSAPLVLEAGPYETTETENTSEFSEVLAVTSESNRSRRDRKTTLSYKLEIKEARKGDRTSVGSLETEFAGHRLLAGELAPLRC